MKPLKSFFIKFMVVSLTLICSVVATFVILGRTGTYSWFTARIRATGAITAAKFEEVIKEYKTLDDNGNETIVNPTKIKLIFYKGIDIGDIENIKIQFDNCIVDDKQIKFVGTVKGFTDDILDKSIQFESIYLEEGNLAVIIPVKFRKLTEDEVFVFKHSNNYNPKPNKNIDNPLYITFKLSCFGNGYIQIELPSCEFRSSYLMTK